MPNKECTYFLTQDGKLISTPTDELYHWKYIKREKVGDGWRYWYPDDKSAGNKATVSVQKSVKQTPTTTQGAHIYATIACNKAIDNCETIMKDYNYRSDMFKTVAHLHDNRHDLLYKTDGPIISIQVDIPGVETKRRPGYKTLAEEAKELEKVRSELKNSVTQLAEARDDLQKEYYSYKNSDYHKNNDPEYKRRLSDMETKIKEANELIDSSSVKPKSSYLEKKEAEKKVADKATASNADYQNFYKTQSEMMNSQKEKNASARKVTKLDKAVYKGKEFIDDLFSGKKKEKKKKK